MERCGLFIIRREEASKSKRLALLETHSVLFPFHLEPFSRPWNISGTAGWKGGSCKFSLLFFLPMLMLVCGPHDETGLCEVFYRGREVRTEPFSFLSGMIWTPAALGTAVTTVIVARYLTKNSIPSLEMHLPALGLWWAWPPSDVNS